MRKSSFVLSTTRWRALRAVIIAVIVASMGSFLISFDADATVTPGNIVSLVSSGQRMHENSTAFPVIGFSATSDSSDTLDRVDVTLVNRGGFTFSDLKGISTNASSSGIAIYRDSGSEDDELDSSDIALTPSSVGRVSNTVIFNLSSETVPSSVSGHRWLIIVRTSSSVGITDSFNLRIQSGDITFSDSTTMPSSTFNSNTVAVYHNEASWLGTSSPVPIGERGVNVDTIALQGISLFSGFSDLERVSSVTVDLVSDTGFDPWTDLRSISASGNSGVGIYLDDGGTSPDEWAPSEDTLIVPSKVSVVNGSGVWEVTMDLNTTGQGVVWLPSATSGSYEMFITVSSSASIGHGDRFYTSISSWGLEVLGQDGTRSGIVPENNRSREITADTEAPDLSTGTLRITSDTGYFYSEDTDLQGQDRIFFNSLSGMGEGQRITARFQGYTEDFPDKLEGETAFDKTTTGPVDDTDSTDQNVWYIITSSGTVDNPLTFTLTDKVGHSTTWDVDYIRDNEEPEIENLTIRDGSPFITSVYPSSTIYFRNSMISTDYFHITGNSYESAGESGLRRADFTLESGLASSPPTDNTPSSFNGSYGVDSTSVDSNSPLKVTVYDMVYNEWTRFFTYERVSEVPDVILSTPSNSGLNVSGIYRVLANVRSAAPLDNVRFSYGEDGGYADMTYSGSFAGWDTYFYDWDTLTSEEGAQSIRIRAQDGTGGVGYNISWVYVNNYPLWGYFNEPLPHGSVRGEIEPSITVSEFCKGAQLYLGNTLVDSWIGSSSSGQMEFDLDTSLFEDGIHELRAHLQGFGGNSRDISVSIRIDNSPPDISSTWVGYPGDQTAAKVGDKVRLKARISDNQSGVDSATVVANSIGGGMNQTLYDDGAHDDSLPNDGIFSSEEIDVDTTWAFHIVRYVVSDEAGNDAEARLEIPVDPRPPLVEEAWMSYPGEQGAAKTGDQVQVMAQVSDNTAPIYVTLVLDNSGSMMQNGKDTQLIRAAKAFINSTRSIDYVSIYRFLLHGESPHPGGFANWGMPVRMLNFTRMNSTGKNTAKTAIEGVQFGAGTPIWDAIGNATRYTTDNAQSSPVVVAFTDGADDYNSNNPPLFEEGSQNYCPWHDWGGSVYYSQHVGKYEDRTNSSNYWIYNPINEWRMGLLNSPIPIYTVGLGLEHHDPPNQPKRTTAPGNYQNDNNAYWTGESGTTEYNLWRIATTSAGGSYSYAPSATQLETIYRNIATSIYSTENPAKIVKVLANVPLEVTKRVILYDDGLHNDGLAGDGLYGSDMITLPSLLTEKRAVLIEAHDWAANMGLGEAEFIIDLDLPVSGGVTMHYPDNRSSVADGEEFYMEIKGTDTGSWIYRVRADGEEIGFFPPITFNDTGKGNDLEMDDDIFTSINVTPSTGGAPSKYYFLEIIIIDQAGNAIKERAQVLVVNDKETPTVEMINPIFGGYLSEEDEIKAIVRDDGVVRTVRFTMIDDNGTVVLQGFLEDRGFDVFSTDVDVSALREGIYSLEVKANDTAGRIGSSGLLILSIDNSRPLLKVLSPGNGTYVSGVVDIIYHAYDSSSTLEPLEVTYSVDGGPRNSADYSMDTTDYSEGYHQVVVRARDLSGKTRSVYLDLYFDNSLPQVEIISPRTGILANGTIEIVVRASDGGGIQYVEAQLYDWANRSSPTPPQPGENPFASIRLEGPSSPIVVAGYFYGNINTEGITDGRYLLMVKATDRSGSPGVELMEFRVDNHAPDIRISSPIEGGSINGLFTPEVQVIDPFLSRAFYLFNGVEYDLSATLNLSDIPEGRYSMRFTATDQALRTAIVDMTVYVDRSAPVVELLSPGDMSTHSGELNVLARVRETSGISYALLYIDGSSVAFGKQLGDGDLYSFDLNLSSFNRSAHRVWIEMENGAGLKGTSEKITIFKDHLDSDGDGVLDMYDDAPFDPLVSGDIDGDGFGSFYDDDDDGDGVLDVLEPEGESLYVTGESKGVEFSKDPDEWRDTDGDGIGNNADPDMDGDGVANENDAFPLDMSEWSDIDGDGLGDNTDPDMDGDGVKNEDDDLPTDPEEWRDTDGDGVGNRRDEDDDGDGVSDNKDDFPLDPDRQYRWEPILFISLIALICVILLFVGFVFRERIDRAAYHSWEDGWMFRIRRRMSRRDKKEENSGEDEKGDRRDRDRASGPNSDKAKRSRKVVLEEETEKKENRSSARNKRRSDEEETGEEEKEGYKVKWGK